MPGFGREGCRFEGLHSLAGFWCRELGCLRALGGPTHVGQRACSPLGLRVKPCRQNSRMILYKLVNFSNFTALTSSLKSHEFMLYLTR